MIMIHISQYKCTLLCILPHTPSTSVPAAERIMRKVDPEGSSAKWARVVGKPRCVDRQSWLILVPR